MKNDCEAASKTMREAVIGRQIVDPKNAAIPPKIKIFGSRLVKISLTTEPIPLPMAIDGATIPPADPEAKVNIVLKKRAATSPKDKKVSVLAKASFTVFTPSPTA